ncbi:hypothetical protein J5TS2_28000 [Brevibacillus halotolerans]|nr:hypothetical protein J5TS2_28000 [Brevibacillus halotolerans]
MVKRLASSYRLPIYDLQRLYSSEDGKEEKAKTAPPPRKTPGGNKEYYL